jgi:hypothetical protein
MQRGTRQARPSEPSGALVVNTTPRLHRAQLEIHAIGSPWAGAIAPVRESRGGTCSRYAGVFARLDPGRYEFRLLGSRSGVVVPVVIRPGAVVETWLDAPVD